MTRNRTLSESLNLLWMPLSLDHCARNVPKALQLLENQSLSIELIAPLRFESPRYFALTS